MWGKMAPMPYVRRAKYERELASHSFSFNSLFQDNNAHIHTQGTAAGPHRARSKQRILLLHKSAASKPRGRHHCMCAYIFNEK
jgi:hypothetical protein